MFARLILASLTLFVSGRSLCAQDSWLMSFPEIAFDDTRLCFSNARWTGYFHLESQLMYTVPRDSIALPPLLEPSYSVGLEQDLYTASVSDIIHLRVPELPETYALPRVEGATADVILESWERKPESLSDVTEEIGPLALYGHHVWFGIFAHDSGNQLTGGLGWFDTVSQQFGRVYSPALAGQQPVWIGGLSDTVFVMYEQPESGDRQLISYAIATGQLSQFDPRGVGIPGAKVLNVGQWRNALAMATDEAVAVWAPGQEPAVWTTKAYVANDFIRLKMLKFKDGQPDESSIQEFLPMRVNRPSEVMARVGNWIEVVAHEGVEAEISTIAWTRNAKRWRNLDWGCAEPCFARVRVPTRDTYLEGDILNTPITFIDYLNDGVKVGFTAGWIQIDSLAPALLPYP